jgi:hypothetical protein
MPETVTIAFKNKIPPNTISQLKKTSVIWDLRRADKATTIVSGTTSTDDFGKLIINIPDGIIDDREKLHLIYEIDGIERKTDVPKLIATYEKNITDTFVAAAKTKIINEGRDWLGYESLFNRVRNRKSNKKYTMGLYILYREDVCVWFRDNLDDETLNNLTAAFFPEYNPQKHLDYSNSIWDWKTKKGGIIKDALSPVKKIPAAREEIKLNLGSYVVLPYNYFDNNVTSRALGTTKLNAKAKQLKDDLTWDFWKTASRSCIVRVKRIKEKAPKWKTVTKEDAWGWKYESGNADRTKDYETKLDFLLDKPFDKTGYKLSSFINSGDTIDVSLKTGVIYVGSEEQSGTGKKDFLDSNWIIACLRSDYVVAVNKELEAKGVKIGEQQLVVLTELLSITEKDERTTAETTLKDGIQVRDISTLDKSKIYLAPLNIPHVDTDLKEFKDQFACFDDEKWREFWRKHWAISLGRAKALFLLRYGLQHINPNPQNYLIEFTPDGENPKPTGRIIIRDLQDAAIHREAVWALYGVKDELPPEGESNQVRLGELSQPVLKYEFTDLDEGRQETGTTDRDQNFGPPGTQFLWQRFSAFGSGNKPAVLDTLKVEQWRIFLATMARWGKSHNRAYVRCLESQLGVNLTKIDWSSIPRPDRYLEKSVELKTVGNECLGYQDSVSTVGDNPPVIEKIDLQVKFPKIEKGLVGSSTEESWESVFEDKYPGEFTTLGGTSCFIIKGNNFQNSKVEVEGDVGKVWISSDSKRIYFVLPEESKKLFDRRLLPTVVTNYDSVSKLIGTATHNFKAKEETDMGWEENAALKVHDYLQSKAGQTAIQAYKERGWKPVEPKFKIQCLTKDNGVLEEICVKVISATESIEWIDLTDENGAIQIYGSQEDYQIDVLGYCKNLIKVSEIVKHKEILIDHFHDKKTVKVKSI